MTRSCKAANECYDTSYDGHDNDSYCNDYCLLFHNNIAYEKIINLLFLFGITVVVPFGIANI